MIILRRICSGVVYFGIVLLTAETLGERNACQGFRGNVDTCSDDCKPFNTESYMGMIIVAVAELPSVVLCIFLMDIIGRRALLIFASVSFSGCFSLLFFCIEPQIITTSILFASKFFSQIIYLVLFAYTPEIYPTSVRGLALGAGVAVTRIGTTLAPLNAQVLASHSVMASIAVITAAGVVSIVTSLLLPVETKGQQINTSVQDSRYKKHDDGNDKDPAR
ncbi:Synaptic vesicle 2-related protein [Holothuria leucospilota]|uniref:Synaptic vesicle 2-related protein n=1 Tax=Holothuria leucospilota TaxID=206669 RepID=A0A9Q1CGD9_HOLLE|nr:Synaptic vesicle 2-related protein [Holothuria leucospilota]